MALTVDDHAVAGKVFLPTGMKEDTSTLMPQTQ
jgi:hypothetical protein